MGSAPPIRAGLTTGNPAVKAHFEMMARYNRWANRRLYNAAEMLSEEDYRRDCGAFFGSLHNTLNHLFVTDVIWMSRFRGQPNPPWSLDHIAHNFLNELSARRRAMDCDILGFVMCLTEARLAEEFSYMRVTDSQKITQDYASALAHFFNHQTHHRGQCHAMLSHLGAEAPPLDLLVYQRET